MATPMSPTWEETGLKEQGMMLEKRMLRIEFAVLDVALEAIGEERLDELMAQGKAVSIGGILLARRRWLQWKAEEPAPSRPSGTTRRPCAGAVSCPPAW